MNRFTRIATPGYELVTGHSYTITEADARRLCEEGRYDGYSTDTGGPIKRVSFRKRDGGWITYPLNHPICSGCDGALDQGVCDDCAVVHGDVLPEGFVEIERLPSGAVLAW